VGRRIRGDGGVYQRADGQWVGSVDVGWVAGKRKRRVVYGRTQGEAFKKLQQAQREIEQGRLQTSNMTVEKWLRYWLDEIAGKKVKPRTLLTYRSYVETHLVKTLGKKRLDRLEAQHVRELHKAVLVGHSSTTALHAHRILSTALEAARKEGVTVRNVATLVDAPSRAVSDREGLTLIEAKRLLAAAGEDPMASRWWAALLTGARQGECLGLRWDHVDLDAAVADIAWSLQRIPYSHGCGAKTGEVWPCGRKWGARCPQHQVEAPPGMEYRVLEGNICLVRPKTKGSRRVVPLLPAMVAALRVHRERDTGPNPHGLIWHRPDGRPLDGRIDYEAWCALLEKAKVDHVTLHEARNTTATLLLEAGVDPHVIASMLGHSHITTTRGYQKVSLELARRAIGGLGEQLGLT
jgi:integrase